MSPREPHPEPHPPAAGGDPLAALDEALARFSLPPAPRTDGREAGANSPARTVVAFSGGPDSTALLLAWSRQARRHGAPLPVAVHLDHACDPDSRRRARHAARLARRLGVPFVGHRLRPGQAAPPGESAEAAARRLRYRFLRRVAADCGAPWIATGHHRDDQAETVMLRILAGSGLRGLSAIRPARRLGLPGRPWLVRPLLGLPGATLRAAVTAAGLTAAEDATNRDLSIPRNLLRHHALPRLETAAAGTGGPPLAPRLARLAGAARGAFATVDRVLARHLELETSPHPAAAAGSGGDTPWRPPTAPERASLDLAALRGLPSALFPHALGLLHRSAGAAYPPGREARRQLRHQLRRQLAGGGPVGCDAGGGWRWESRAGERLALTRAPTPGDSPPSGFSYILEAPGEVEIGEIGSVLRLYRAPLAAWMYHGSEHRAGLASDLPPGGTVTVRSRRPGDRMRPLGAGGSRRLKDVLIDHRVPRRHRHRLPLVILGGEIAWVPGVIVGEPFRLPTEPAAGATVWVAELFHPGEGGGADNPESP